MGSGRRLIEPVTVQVTSRTARCPGEQRFMPIEAAQRPDAGGVSKRCARGPGALRHLNRYSMAISAYRGAMVDLFKGNRNLAPSFNPPNPLPSPIPHAHVSSFPDGSEWTDNRTSRGHDVRQLLQEDLAIGASSVT
jgi:hypothetical protein